MSRQRLSRRKFEFENINELLEEIGHSEPHLEWLHAANAFDVFSNPIIQALLDDPEVGEWLSERLAMHRNRQMLRYLSAADPDEQLIGGGIIKAAREARLKYEKTPSKS